MLKKIKQFLRDLVCFLYLFFYVLFYVISLGPIWHLLAEVMRYERGIQEAQEGRGAC